MISPLVAVVEVISPVAVVIFTLGWKPLCVGTNFYSQLMVQGVSERGWMDLDTSTPAKGVAIRFDIMCCMHLLQLAQL